MKTNRYIVIALIGALLCTASFELPQVFASSAQDKLNEAQQNKQEKEEELENLEEEQQDVLDGIEAAGAQLAAIVAQQAELQAAMTAKTEEMIQTGLELDAAELQKANEYEAMTLRIQYMYENSTTNSIWTALLESESLADMLKNMEYVLSVHQSDRELMEQYEATVQTITDLLAQQQTEMDEMLALQEEYAASQIALENTIAYLEEQSSSYATQIAEARASIAEYDATIVTQTQIIVAQQAANSAGNSGTGGNSGGSGSAGNTEGVSGGGQNPGPVTDVSGSEVIAYARNFLGNPYVWGGTDLYNGIDCSGFVLQVYAHFGVFSQALADIHGHTSATLRSVGQPVSVENIQVGDIVCYQGHVALYSGNGMIIEAMDSDHGIVEMRRFDCKPILAIRRVI